MVFVEDGISSQPPPAGPKTPSEPDVDIVEDTLDMSQADMWEDGEGDNEDDPEPDDEEAQEDDDLGPGPRGQRPSSGSGAPGGQGAPGSGRYPTGDRRQTSEWWRAFPERAAAVAVVEEPLTVEALSSDQAEEWRQAMDEEIRSLHARQSDLDH